MLEAWIFFSMILFLNSNYKTSCFINEINKLFHKHHEI